MVSGSLGLLASDGCVTSHCHTQQHTDLCVKRINEQPSDGREKSATIGDVHEWGSVWFSHYRHEDEGGEGSGDQGDNKTHLIKPLKGVDSEDHLSASTASVPWSRVLRTEGFPADGLITADPVQCEGRWPCKVPRHMEAPDTQASRNSREGRLKGHNHSKRAYVLKVHSDDVAEPTLDQKFLDGLVHEFQIRLNLI